MEWETLDEEEILEVTGLPPAPPLENRKVPGLGRRLPCVGERYGVSREAPGGQELIKWQAWMHDEATSRSKAGGCSGRCGAPAMRRCGTVTR